MHVFFHSIFLVSLFTNGLLPLEIFKVPYQLCYLTVFDKTKRRISSLKESIQWYVECISHLKIFSKTTNRGRGGGIFAKKTNGLSLPTI